MESLFGHIILSFKSRNDAENLATNSLHYILNNSKSAQDALLDYINSIKFINTKLFFRTQVHDDEDRSIPDLVGFDDENDQVCIIESKFWAGLTDHQPVTYIKRLHSLKPSMLVFLVPAKRIDSIWSELVSRCSKEGLKIVNTARKPHAIYGNLNQNQVLCVTDWSSLLSHIETELDVTGDYRIKSDVLQLKGLCDQMDEKAFLPLDSMEINPMIPKRNIQFAELVDNVIEYGKEKNFSQDNTLSHSTGKHSYGRYIMIGNYYFNFKFDNKLWSDVRNNPFWLEVWGTGFSKAKNIYLKSKKL